jgi:CheY-like chemotaxis protein
VALLDVAMPCVQDGYTLARQLRGDVPLLMAVTGFADDEHRRSCEQAGFDLFLAKPLDHEQFQALLAAAARLIAQAGQSNELAEQTRQGYAEFLVQWRRDQKLAARAKELRDE